MRQGQTHDNDERDRIGRGKQQLGEWKIDARYNKQNLIKKIKLIGLYSDRITVLNEDGVDAIERYVKDPKSFFYVDPPYFVKGADLYLNAFKLKDHHRLDQTDYATKTIFF